MDKIPTWEEAEVSGKWDDYDSMYKALCKLHVKAALKAAAEKAEKTYIGEKTWDFIEFTILRGMQRLVVPIEYRGSPDANRSTR